ncbi:MAG: molecular chaperone DnaK [Candidatus Pacebacteria bacterium]|jgi:molecular chaperone DnaK|nr:molecular chaperone DnaK [Candidatus Paceibacterota bacterium]
MARTIGIDLGTTLSEMAAIVNGEPKILDNKEGSRLTPSVVAVTKTGERLVGVLAKRQQITNPKNTLFSIKRLIGRRYTDQEVQRDKKLLPYEIRERAEDGGVEVKMGEKWYAAPEISAMVLQKLKQDAEAKLGEPVTDAIITVPAYFDDSQRKATKLAGEIAGFNVKRIINEPTAAALAYGLTKKKNEQVLVYDFGGGTFDISILDISADTVEVKATGGDNHLGGDDVDQRLISWLVDEFKRDNGIDLAKDELSLQRLKEGAERAKIELSTAMETEINLPFITSDAAGPKHLYYKLTRAKLEDLIRDLIDRSIALVKQVLSDAKLATSDIEEIVLVGGQTRMPLIVEEVKKLFGKEPNKSINPDEVVAIGAAVEAGILQGEVKDVLLLDVTPLSLGIETMGGVNTVLIAKNTTVPTAKSQVFSTASDNQTSVEIHVLQGERPMSADNKSLGQFILDGIMPAPRGLPQIEVTFDIDANGILSVTAKDKATGKTQTIRIEGSTGISKEEVERMKREAEANAESDKKKQDLITARNLADNLIYTAEKAMRDAGEKLSADTKKGINDKIDALKKVKDGDNMDDIKAKTDDLSQTLSKAGAQLYQQPGASAGSGQGPAGDQQNPNQEGQGPSAGSGQGPEEGEFKEK